MKELTLEELGKQAHEFLNSDFGKHVMVRLSQSYVDKHTKAEAEGLTAYGVAALVNQAKGVKVAIDLLKSFDAEYERKEKTK